MPSRMCRASSFLKLGCFGQFQGFVRVLGIQHAYLLLATAPLVVLAAALSQVLDPEDEDDGYTCVPDRKLRVLVPIWSLLHPY